MKRRPRLTVVGPYAWQRHGCSKVGAMPAWQLSAVAAPRLHDLCQEPAAVPLVWSAMAAWCCALTWAAMAAWCCALIWSAMAAWCCAPAWRQPEAAWCCAQARRQLKLAWRCVQSPRRSMVSCSCEESWRRLTAVSP